MTYDAAVTVARLVTVTILPETDVVVVLQNESVPGLYDMVDQDVRERCLCDSPGLC